MATLHAAADRGRTRIAWLDSWHTFSFADFHDRNRMGHGALRVVNDDLIAPGGGFDTHAHRDMEIVTIVLAGALRHRDSMGNGSVIRPGEVQRMSAGTGVLHSEHNDSSADPVHLLQIWIVPDRRGLPPGYEQRTFDTRGRAGQWVLVASPDGRLGAVTIHQDAALRRAFVPVGTALDTRRGAGRRGFLHVATGRVVCDGRELAAGDALALDADEAPTIEGVEAADILLFDLA